jgi:PAS domain S-box-containing protein
MAYVSWMDRSSAGPAQGRSRRAVLEQVFPGDSEMARRMRALDWSATPAGSVGTWPESLKTALRIVLHSRYPMFIWWGPDALTTFYNDAYAPILGEKHPRALGSSGVEVWSEIWPTLGEFVTEVFVHGRGTFSEDLLLVMRRHGYLEETYFTFSYSPILERDGGVAGLFCACIEDTQRVVQARRLRTVRELAVEVTASSSVEDACVHAARSLDGNPHDLPFALLYVLDDDGATARLVATTELGATTRVAWPVVGVGEHDPLGFAQVLAERASVATRSVAAAFEGPVPSGSWPDPPERALVVPVARPGHDQPAGFAVLGVAPRRPFDDDYRGFLEMVAGHVATGMANARAYEEERRRAEALAELDRAKTTFFSNVSHEFRTPLTLMLGPLEDALSGRDEALGPRTRERVDLAYRNGLRLLKLVNSLLDFSRIEAGRLRATYEETDVCAYTTELAGMFRSAVERAGLTLDVRCAPEAVAAYLDRDMWEKVVLNLLSNAFKFTLEGGIVVTVRRRDAEVVVSVRDTGSGIPPEHLPHVFERFHRVAGAKGRTHEGTGIGLALVQELVKLHGGSIAVRSELGKGSDFEVVLPTGCAHLPPEQIVLARPLGPPSSVGASAYVEEALRSLPDVAATGLAGSVGDEPVAVRATGGRVLLADDNPDMRAYLARLLATYWEVDAVADGDEALAAIRARRPDLVLSDVMMPRLDGFGLLRAIRGDPATRTLPVILLSARAGEEARVEGLDAGADDYLVKPFAARELIARVNTHLEMARLRREELRAREQMERELRESEERFRQMADNAPVMVWVTDPDGARSYLSRSWYEFTGKPRDSGLGNGWLQAIHPEDRPRVEEAFRAANERREPLRIEYRLVRHDGEARWSIDSAAPRTGADGRFLGHVGSVLDIAERKRMEEALQDADRRKDEFLAMLAHELRSPLAPILNATKLLAVSGEPGARREHARDIIERQTAHLARLVDDLLDVSRITRGTIDLQREPLALDAVVAAGVELARPLIDRLGHTLVVTHDTPGARLEGDFARLVQVVSNLLTNAAKFTPPRGSVSVRTRLADGEVSIVVRDTGVGIPHHLQSKVFDLFVQDERGLARSQGGLGIGLTLVKRIVELHGGTVTAHSEGENRGSELVVTLPASAAAAGLPAPADVVRRDGGAAVALRILLVEDNPDTAESFALLLRLGGHEVRVASDGLRALDEVEGFSPDVAFLDVGLPGIDGYELAARLRAHRACADATLVALTGYGREEDKRRATDAGFDHHLTKPVDFDAVLALIDGAAGGVKAEPRAD